VGCGVGDRLLDLLRVRSPLNTGSPEPKVDPGHLKRHGPTDYIVRFAFGFGISAAAAIVSTVFGAKIGGVLLAFPAILPASLTLIERQDGRHEAMTDATGAILGSFALIAFAAIAAVTLSKFTAVLALVLATAVWLAVAFALYVLIVWLPRRRKSAVTRARPTSA
jgi:Protein of unknown function (DUF3147)